MRPAEGMKPAFENASLHVGQFVSMSKEKGKKLNNRIRELRARHRLTQEELAHRVDVSRQTIIAIEKGDYNPSVALALRIAAELEVSLEEAFWLTDE
jgi:putative transcriptional regulator